MEVPKVKLFNVITLGVTFLLVFAAFNTIGNIQQLIFDSAMNSNATKADGYVEGFSGNSFTSLAIVYTVFTFFNWFAPSVISLIGPRFSMMAGALTYCLFIGQLLYPQVRRHLCVSLSYIIVVKYFTLFT